MKDSFISGDKKFLNNLFENLVFQGTISATEVKKVIKSFSKWDWIINVFSSLVINDSVPLLFCFIVTKVFILFQVSFIYLMFSLKKSVKKFFPLAFFRSVDSWDM